MKTEMIQECSPKPSRALRVNFFNIPKVDLKEGGHP